MFYLLLALMRVGVQVIALALLCRQFLNRGNFFAFVNPAKKITSRLRTIKTKHQDIS